MAQSLRSQKVSSTIWGICSNALAELRQNDTDLLTILSVDVSADLRYCKVVVSSFKTKISQDQKTELQADLQRALAKQLKSKFTPRLRLEIIAG